MTASPKRPILFVAPVQGRQNLKGWNVNIMTPTGSPIVLCTAENENRALWIAGLMADSDAASARPQGIELRK